MRNGSCLQLLLGSSCVLLIKYLEITVKVKMKYSIHPRNIVKGKTTQHR